MKRTAGAFYLDGDGFGLFLKEGKERRGGEKGAEKGEGEREGEGGRCRCLERG